MTLRIIGACILLLVLGAIFALTVIACGIKDALICWGVLLLFTTLISVGAYLLFG